jgi:hypothetical protein
MREVEAYLLAAEAHSGTVEAHNGALEVIRRALTKNHEGQHFHLTAMLPKKKCVRSVWFCVHMIQYSYMTEVAPHTVADVTYLVLHGLHVTI